MRVLTGECSPAVSAYEQTLQQQILGSSMPQTKAQKLLSSVDEMDVWVSHVGFVERLVAMSAIYRTEVMKNEEGKAVYHLLWQAAQPDRLGWLFNNARARARMSAAEQMLLPNH